MVEFTTVEINNFVFCIHLKEVCTECDYDGRYENDAFFGYKPLDRELIEPPTAILNERGVYQCKEHERMACRTCFGWHKRIVKLRAAARKAGKK